MGRGQLAWIRLGLATAGLIFALLGSPPHPRAQDVTQYYPPGPATQRLPVLANRESPPFSEHDDRAAAPATSEPADDDDPDQITDDPAAPDPVMQAARRAVVQDGDQNGPAEPTAPEDGTIDLSEPPVVQDGSATAEARTPEDIAAFENPPAGFDPLLFQIEDLDPILDNRHPRRLFQNEPYDPVGIRIGSFVLFPEVEFGGLWNSNVFLAPNARSDVALDVRPSARLVSNWTTHALEFRATGDFSFYNEFESEDDDGYLLEARGRLDITKRTSVQALVSRGLTQESRSALDASAIGTRADVLTERAEATFNHRFNRLSVQFRGSVTDYSYGDTEAFGVVTNNDDRDNTVYEETVRLTWELKPSLMPFAEVAVNQRSYDLAAVTDLINRSSDGQRYRAGLSFGNSGEILRGEVSLGYGIQSPDDSRLRDIDGLLVDANATWRVTDLTSLLFTARTDVLETTTTNVGGAFYRFLSIEARHALRRYLIATVGLSYATQNSRDDVIDESELRASAGLEYFLNRETILFGNYVHTNFDAVGEVSDYTSDEVRVGMRIRR